MFTYRVQLQTSTKSHVGYYFNLSELMDCPMTLYHVLCSFTPRRNRKARYVQRQFFLSLHSSVTLVDCIYYQNSYRYATHIIGLLCKVYVNI